MFFDYGQWLQAIGPWSLSIWLEEKPGCIPCPTQNPEVEWDKDLPDIGAEKQYYSSDMNEVRECVAIAHRHGCAVVEDQDGQSYEAVPPNNFIRTKEQRQRDELIAAIPHPGFNTKEDIADAILSRYNMEPKDV